MQVFAIAFLHAIIFWPNIILTEKISRASKSLLYTINHHKLLNLNLKFLLLLMQCQYAKSRWVKYGKIVQYLCKNKYLKWQKDFSKKFISKLQFFGLYSPLLILLLLWWKVGTSYFSTQYIRYKKAKRMFLIPKWNVQILPP